MFYVAGNEVYEGCDLLLLEGLSPHNISAWQASMVSLPL